MTRRRTAAALFVLALLAPLAACGSDGGEDASEATSTTAAASTTAAPEAPAVDEPAYEGEGPHPVGSRTIDLGGRRVVVWYPAAAEAADAPTEVFDIASLLSTELQDEIEPELRPQYEVDAHPGADPATDGPFPVVLFSHGYAGFPEQSVDLTTHLAGWGFVVIAPDHVERSLSGLLGGAAEGIEPQEDPEVLSASLDAAIADGDVEGSPLAGLLDLDRVAVAGHSAGAGAAYRTASTDDRVKAFISYSVGVGPRNGQPAPPVPEVPGMVMLGDADGIIDAQASRDAYAGMNAPKYLVEIAGAGHLVFSDLCLIGRDQGGLVGLIEEAGLDLPEDLLRLASDGCEEGDLDPAQAFGAIDHLSVAFLRHELGIDPEPVGLDPGVTAAFTTAVVTLTVDEG